MLLLALTYLSFSYAKPYNNTITPRSEEKAQWIRENSARIIAERGKHTEERED
jgi:hypothetical protein